MGGGFTEQVLAGANRHSRFMREAQDLFRCGPSFESASTVQQLLNTAP
jgi:hypothetical protein